MFPMNGFLRKAENKAYRLGIGLNVNWCSTVSMHIGPYTQAPTVERYWPPSLQVTFSHWLTWAGMPSTLYRRPILMELHSSSTTLWGKRNHNTQRGCPVLSCCFLIIWGTCKAPTHPCQEQHRNQALGTKISLCVHCATQLMSVSYTY